MLGLGLPMFIGSDILRVDELPRDDFCFLNAFDGPLVIPFAFFKMGAGFGGTGSVEFPVMAMSVPDSGAPIMDRKTDPELLSLFPARAWLGIDPGFCFPTGFPSLAIVITA